jgi:hypothetical protein
MDALKSSNKLAANTDGVEAATVKRASSRSGSRYR